MSVHTSVGDGHIVVAAQAQVRSFSQDGGTVSHADVFVGPNGPDTTHNCVAVSHIRSSVGGHSVDADPPPSSLLWVASYLRVEVPGCECA